MKYKVVIFDLFETLITEWGHKKYTKNEMCADLGIERAEFDVFWDEKEQDRYVGKLSFEDSILYVSKKCGKYVDNTTISNIIDKRIKTKSVCFEYVHPEVFHFVGDERAYETEMRRICQAAAEADVPLEINFLGIREGRHYPIRRFWQWAAEYGCRVVFGFDAHDAESAYDGESLAVAEAWVRELGLRLEPNPSIRPL